MRTESGQENDGTLATLTPAATAPGQSFGVLPLARTAAEQTADVVRELPESAAEAGIYTRQPGSVSRLVAAVSERFRLPNPDDPAPSTPRLLLIALWSAALGLAGLLPAAQVAVMALFHTQGPTWYAHTTVIIGVIGVMFVAAAFASIHRRRLPFGLMGVASVLLIANVTLIYTAL